jgi:hypothetical protein
MGLVRISDSAGGGQESPAPERTKRKLPKSPILRGWARNPAPERTKRKLPKSPILRGWARIPRARTNEAEVAEESDSAGGKARYPNCRASHHVHRGAHPAPGLSSRVGGVGTALTPTIPVQFSQASGASFPPHPGPPPRVGRRKRPVRPGSWWRLVLPQSKKSRCSTGPPLRDRWTLCIMAQFGPEPEGLDSG